MKRLFRTNAPGWTDYAGLALFGLVYLATIGLLIAV